MDTRARLLATARTAFAEHGHDRVNLKTDILEPAGVSVGSFYHQFADKTELLITLLDDAAEEWRGDVVGERAPEGSFTAEDGIRAAYTRFVTGLEANSELWQINLRERHNVDPRIRQRVQRGREAWRRDLIARFDDDGSPADVAERATDMVLLLSVGVATTYLDRPRSQRTASARRALVDDLTAFTAGGLVRLGAGGSPA
jgi:AcrR family transcriptional regulator